MAQPRFRRLLAVVAELGAVMVGAPLRAADGKDHPSATGWQLPPRPNGSALPGAAGEG